MLCLCRRRAFCSLQLLSERSDLSLELLHLCLRFLQEPLMRKVLLPRSQALSRPGRTARASEESVGGGAYDVDRGPQQGDGDHARDIVRVELSVA